MDDYSENIELLDADDSDLQLAGLAFFAACDESLLTDKAISKLIELAETAQNHVADIASSIISQAVSRREREAVSMRLKKKLFSPSASEIAMRDLEWAVKIKSDEMKAGLEKYLDRCTDPAHISWLVKNLPQAYPDPQQIPLLKSFLTYGDDRIVSNTLEGLACIDEPDLIATFAQMLHHASNRVRSVAAAALAAASPDVARKVLFSMLQNPDKTASIKSACHAIRHISGKDFLDLVIPLLKHESAGEEAAKTVAWLAFKKVEKLFEDETFKSNPDIKTRVTASIIELLREECKKSAFLSSADDSSAQANCRLTCSEKAIVALEPQLTPAQAEKLAEENKHRWISFFSRLIYRPKDEEIELISSKALFKPFWHIISEARVDYTREKKLDLNLGAQVREIKIGDQYFKTNEGKSCLTIDERCTNSISHEKFIDAVNGEELEFKELIRGKKRILATIAELICDDFTIIPARLKASIPLRNIMHEIMQPLKAIEILSQSLKIEKLHLYYRPVFAFEYTWKPRKQNVAFEIDGVTGKITQQKSAIEPGNKKISEASLFDIGADAIGLVVPGGEIAAKIAMALLGKNK